MRLAKRRGVDQQVNLRTDGKGGSMMVETPSTPGFSDGCGSGSGMSTCSKGMDPSKAEGGVYVHFTTAVNKSEFLCPRSLDRRVFDLFCSLLPHLFFTCTGRQHASRHASRYGSHGSTVDQGDGAHVASLASSPFTSRRVAKFSLSLSFLLLGLSFLIFLGHVFSFLYLPHLLKHTPSFLPSSPTTYLTPTHSLFSRI